jgi:hypothetical protein
MTHEEMRDRLLDLAYGELLPRDAREVEEHAASCEGCAAELARIRGTRRLMAALPVEPAPPQGERILVAAAREAARRRPPRRLVPRWALAAAVAAASLAAVAAVSWRIVAMRPGGIGREDPQALMGDAPYARPAPEGAPPAARPAEREELAAAPRAAEREELAAAPRPAPESGAAPPAERGAPARDRVTDGGPRRAAPARRFAEAPPPEAAPSSEAPPARRPEPAPERRADADDASAPEAGPGPAYAAAPPHEAEAQDRAEANRASPPSPPRSGGEGRGEGAAGAAAAPSRAPSAPPSAAARAQPDAPAPDAVLRYDDLRRSGRLREEVRTFPGCDGELWRKVERDAHGRIVSYAREGFLGDRRLRVEALYGPGGAPVRVTVTDAATSAPLVGAKPWVPSAAEADGPPRCARGAN